MVPTSINIFMIQRRIHNRVAAWQPSPVHCSIRLNVRVTPYQPVKQLASTNVGCPEGHSASRTGGMRGEDSTSPPQGPLDSPSIANA